MKSEQCLPALHKSNSSLAVINKTKKKIVIILKNCVMNMCLEGEDKKKELYFIFFVYEQKSETLFGILSELMSCSFVVAVHI